MTKLHYISVLLAGLGLATAMHAQNEEGLLPTQALVAVEAKSQPPAGPADITVQVDGHKAPLQSWTPVVPAQAEVALLIDDGLRESVGRNLISLRAFLNGLPPSVKVMVGYMQNGRVAPVQDFTTDHAAAAAALRLPEGVPGISASPYFCLSDFVKHWPGVESAVPGDNATIQRGAPPASARKARFVLMISNGVDPYNGSTSIMNQDSPYVQSAITDAQRAGVPVYSIYFSDAGMRGGSPSFSGQSYLQQVADATGGRSYYEGVGNPVDMQPFLRDFTADLGRTYIATFEAPTHGHDLARVKFSSDSKSKLRAPQAVLPGNIE